MRYSKLFGKTQVNPPKEAETVSHKLLTQAGFIDRQLAAGIFSYLPLGWRTLQQVAEIIRQEINRIGGQEVFLPSLQPKYLWEKSGRWGTMDPPLFKLKDRHERELTLASTHEEVITDLVARFVNSYKDLPVALYQIQNKFRNEMRATNGLLRVREFIMKDLYSFHADEKDLDKFYWQVVEAYQKIFTRCGLVTKVVEATSGSIGGNFCHEFMMLCPTGEDKIVYCSQCDWAISHEKIELEKLKVTKCLKCGQKVAEASCIENGHVFKLGTKYAKPLGAYYLDQNGQKNPLVMGCYGIGLGRLMATIVEANHDEKGIIWPKEVTPFPAHLISLEEKGSEIYEKLQSNGVEVLYDDRKDVSAGSKFADADLIGLPVRLLISPKTKGQVEWKERNKSQTELVTVTEMLSRFKKGSAAG